MQNAKFCRRSIGSRNNRSTRTNIRPGTAFLPIAAKLERRGGGCGRGNVSGADSSA